MTDLFGETPHPALPDLFVEWEPTHHLKLRVDVLDLAPTFLALMNEPVPGEMTGHPLTSWLEDQRVRR